MRLPRSMKIRPRLLAAAPLLAAVLAMSCGPGKVEQCNTFVQKANGIQKQIGQLVGGDKPDELEKAAGSVDKLTTELSDLPLKDPRLTEYRGKYCDGLKKTSQYLRDLAGLYKDLPTTDEKKLEERNQKVREVQQHREEQAKAEEKLVEEINDYCSGKS